MPDAEKQGRMERVARALEDVVLEGDEFQVIATADDILVNETRAAQFQEKHPRLYGRLLSLNEQMAGGCAYSLIALLSAGSLFFALHVGWLDDVLGAQAAETLNSWWFLAILLVLAFVISGSIYDWEERRIYRRNRLDLFDIVRTEGFDRDTLLVQIKDDPGLDRILKQLMRDPQPPKAAEQASPPRNE